MYHRVFSVKYSDFCILVILVSLQASFRPVIIKQTDIPSMVALPKQIPFWEKKNSLTNLLFGMTVYPFIRSRGKKTELPGGYCQKCTSAERNQHPPRAGTSLLDCAHSSPWGRGYMRMPCAHVAFHLSIYTHLRTKGHFHISLCSFSINFLQFFLESYK